MLSLYKILIITKINQHEKINASFPSGYSIHSGLLLMLKQFERSWKSRNHYRERGITPCNQQKWESLPKDIQQAIASVSGLEAAKFWGRNFFDTAEEGVMERIKAGGYQMVKYVMPQEEVERWQKVAGEPLWKEWVKKMESKGRPDAQKVLDETLRLLK